MNIFKKIIGLFKRTKEVAATTQLKISDYIKEHKKQIKLMMSLFETMFPPQAGIAKMACIVTNVCYGLGLGDVSKDIADVVEKECQKVYDDFKASLN